MWFITKGNLSWGVSHFGCSTDSDSLLLDKERNWSEKFLLMLRAIKGIVFPRWRISEGMVSRPPGKIRRFILCQLPDITENPPCVEFYSRETLSIIFSPFIIIGKFSIQTSNLEHYVSSGISILSKLRSKFHDSWLGDSGWRKGKSKKTCILYSISVITKLLRLEHFKYLGALRLLG